MVRNQRLAHDNVGTLLEQDIKELFVQCDRWQQANRCAIYTVWQVLARALGVDVKLGYEERGAFGTLDGIVTQVLLEAAEDVFLPEWLLALAALLLHRHEQGALENSTKLSLG